MPSDGPGKLSRRQCTDIIANLLSANGFPAGESELATPTASALVVGDPKRSDMGYVATMSGLPGGGQPRFSGGEGPTRPNNRAAGLAAVESALGQDYGNRFEQRRARLDDRERRGTRCRQESSGDEGH